MLDSGKGQASQTSKRPPRQRQHRRPGQRERTPRGRSLGAAAVAVFLGGVRGRRAARANPNPRPSRCSSGRWNRSESRSARGARPQHTGGGTPRSRCSSPCTAMCAALFSCPFSGGALIPLLSSPSSASDGPSGEAAGMEANKRRLTLDLASTLQRWLKVWRSRASACAGAVKPPSTGRPTKGEADTPLLGSAMRHSQHALGAPPGRYGRYAVRPRLRARGFSRREGRVGQARRERIRD